MYLTSIIGRLSVLGLAYAASVSYDRGYDEASRSLTSVACSDGENGLLTRFGWEFQGSTPQFPNIGGVPAVGGWNSPNCGTCWRLEYEGRAVDILAIDKASGFNIGLRAMDSLTDGRSERLGRVEANATQVHVSNCGI